MKIRKILSLVVLIIIINPLSGQKLETVTVKAGTKILDYFPVSIRYLYSDFVMGRVWFRSGVYTDRMLNYNFLAGEIEFIQGRDTISIANKKEINQVIIAQDTFYYDQGYIEQLTTGKIKAGRKQLYELKIVQNKDSYGSSSAGASTTSYGSLPADGNFYKLTANKDMIFQGSIRYYLSAQEGNFLLFSRKSLYQLFPEKKNQISTFLKQNKINYNSQEDLIKVTDFLNHL